MTTFSDPFPTKEKEAILKIAKPTVIESPAGLYFSSINGVDQKFVDAIAEIEKNNYKFAQETLLEALSLYRDINDREGELKCTFIFTF